MKKSIFEAKVKGRCKRCGKRIKNAKHIIISMTKDGLKYDLICDQCYRKIFTRSNKNRSKSMNKMMNIKDCKNGLFPIEDNRMLFRYKNEAYYVIFDGIRSSVISKLGDADFDESECIPVHVYDLHDSKDISTFYRLLKRIDNRQMHNKNDYIAIAFIKNDEPTDIIYGEVSKVKDLLKRYQTMLNKSTN
jgi:hypothetical protein